MHPIPVPGTLHAFIIIIRGRRPPGVSPPPLRAALRKRRVARTPLSIARQFPTYPVTAFLDVSRISHRFYLGFPPSMTYPSCLQGLPHSNLSLTAARHCHHALRIYSRHYRHTNRSSGRYASLPASRRGAPVTTVHDPMRRISIPARWTVLLAFAV